MARDPIQKVLKDSTETLETYPPILAQATGTPTVRIGTPSTAIPDSGSNCTVDTLSVVTSADASEGDESLTLGSFSDVTDSETGLISNVAASPQTLMTTALTANRTYSIAVSFTLLLDGNEGGGPTLDTAIGTITATVTTDASSITISTQSTSFSTTPTLMTTIALSSSGLNLLTRVSGDIVGADITRSVCSLTGTVGAPDFTRGVRYLITTTTGEVFPVECALTDGDATTLQLADPLPMDVASGSTISGWRITRALSASHTTSIGRGVAWWTATLGGISEEWSTEFRIVERDGSYSLSHDTLVDSSPYIINRRPDADDDYSETIDAAWRRFMLPAILAKGLRPERIVSRQLLEPAHIAACELYVASAYESDIQVRAEKKQDFREQLELVLNASELWVTDEAQNLSPPDPEAARPFLITRTTR
jgi:hypothetical protein